MRFPFIISIFFVFSATLVVAQEEMSLVEQLKIEADSLMALPFDSAAIMGLYSTGTRLYSERSSHVDEIVLFLEGNGSKNKLAFGVSIYLQGLLLKGKDEYYPALKKFNAANRILIPLNHLTLLAETRRQSGVMYQRTGRYRKAIESFKEAERLFPNSFDVGFIRRISTVLSSSFGILAEEEQKIGLIDSAIYYARRYHWATVKDGRSQRAAIAKIGLMFLKSGRFGRIHHLDSAEVYLTKALELAKQEDKKSSQRIANNNLGSLYLLKEEYERSVSHSMKAVALGHKTKSKSGLQSSYDNLRVGYTGLDKPKLALSYADSSYNLAKIIARDKNELLENIVGEVYSRQIEQEAVIHESKLAEEKTFRNALIFILILLAIIILLLFLNQLNKVKANKELAQKNKRIKEVEELKSRWFANVSHDFRSPLTLIKGHMEVVQNDENFLTDRSEISLDKASRNVDQLVMLTDEIRNLTQLDENRLKLNYNKVDINELIGLNVSMFSSQAQLKNIHLKFESSLKEETIIHADGYNLEKILFNLLSNAIKYTQEGGKIEVKLFEVKNEIVFQIRDNGQGILQEELPHVFDRYFQTSTNDYKVQEGLGIGLSLVKELVELHCGTIELESNLGIGSVFTVKLPFNLQESISEPIHTVSYTKKRSSVQSKLELNSNKNGIVPIGNLVAQASSQDTILVVDDHPEVREYICSLIEEKYQVIQAKNGQVAYDLLQKQKVDLVMTDLMMPWMDGFELIEKIKSNDQLSNTKLMVISARSTEEDQHRILDQGVNNFLSKPFNSQELFKRIENLLNGSVNTTWDELSENQNKLSDLEKNLLKKVNDLIVSKIDDPKLTVAWLGQELAASERSVQRIIKNLTGTSPKAYVQRVRISYAEELIKKRKVNSTSEASQAVGIKNVTDFSRQFEKEKGMQPSELFS